MPTTNTRVLKLNRVGANVRIDVSYNVVFSVLERHLAGLGLRFRERISVIGVDPPGATTGTVLPIIFPSSFIAVTDPQPRQHASIIVTRAALDEDQHPLLPPDLDADEIRCLIQIKAVGLPETITPDAFTNEAVLGEVVQTSAAGNAG